MNEWTDALNIDTKTLVNLVSPVLIVVDMQNDFLHPDGLLKAWGGQAIIPNVLKLADAFHLANYPVIFTQVVYGDPERDGGAIAKWWNITHKSMLVREGTWHEELHQSMSSCPKDKIILKRRYSSFFKTDLDLILRSWQVKEVVVAGVCSNVCCEATAHDALANDFRDFLQLKTSLVQWGKLQCMGASTFGRNTESNSK